MVVFLSCCLLSSLRRPGQQFRQSDEVVGGGREVEGPSDPIEAAEPGLPLSGGGFCPAEHFLDTLAYTLADRVTRMAGGASVDLGMPRHAEFAHPSVGGDMRRDPPRAEFLHEGRDIVSFVGGERDPPGSPRSIQQDQRGIALSGTARARQTGIGDKSVTVLHEHMPGIGEHAELSVRLPCQTCVRIGLALVRLVASRPTPPVALSVAPTRGVGTGRLVGGGRIGFGLE
jgi:hypothetical protein